MALAARIGALKDNANQTQIHDVIVTLSFHFSNTHRPWSQCHLQICLSLPQNPSISSNLSGSSLLVAWQLKGKTVLIVGGGEVASGRIEAVLSADAKIVILAPPRVFTHEPSDSSNSVPDRVTYYDRRFLWARRTLQDGYGPYCS